MPAFLDPDRLQFDLLRYLHRGPAAAGDIIRHLRISQSTFSRLVARLREDLLVVGRGRATRYAACRPVEGVGSRIPLYQISESAAAQRVATLVATWSQGFYVEPEADPIQAGFFADLPYFLHDMRPAGFLGRLIPRRHPDLQAPADIQLWTTDQCLAYLTRHGWDLPGNLILGDPAFQMYLRHSQSPASFVPDNRRASRYAELADEILEGGMPGSSAAGEQPKFLATRGAALTPVLVKFSPPVKDALSQRLADLLVAEHLAHQAIAAYGHAAARSQIMTGGGRTFLEVERFDRTPGGGRRGVLSLFALDAEFVGRLRGWTDTAGQLVRMGKIDGPMLHEIRWLEAFGRLIANSDMHAANLSFLAAGTRVLGLAPAYDMLPMAYAPVQGHMRDPAASAPMPAPGDADIWKDACTAARGYWSAISSHKMMSANFREIGRAHVAVIDAVIDTVLA